MVAKDDDHNRTGFNVEKIIVTDTPLTDAAVKEVLQTGQHAKVKAEFARELEKRLAAITKQRDDLFRALAEPIRPAD
jgi:hypothetical protein